MNSSQTKGHTTPKLRYLIIAQLAAVRNELCRAMGKETCPPNSIYLNYQTAIGFFDRNVLILRRFHPKFA